jgi:nitric oxide dioxygenase
MLPLKPYKAGQFITVRMWVDEIGCYQNRHYSLSDVAAADHYRITVKREDGHGAAPAGIISNMLHSLPVGSTVQAAFPIGSFVLPDPVPKNIVLFSGGVGITPNLAILNTVSQADPAAGPNVSWIQCARSPAEHVFKKHVADIAERSNGKVKMSTFYSDVCEKELGPNVAGHRISVPEMDKSLLPLQDKDAAYFVCGPDSFMKDIRRDLTALGVDPKQVSVEAFHAGEL